ncbi:MULTISPECIES: nitrogen fixation protein NifZ [Uliginosibacterium]|jgi:nitrogen fixation protein NifZ|uniref:Nitrogen fixation protein NifZ n=1 Tax=Uliginosibacterium aquaticum TaxID=2731212 RepID=A0ABX2IEN4_9RHOO|nr:MULTISPECIES: nitrogen fixation protein NifZ [Uliginosibacterium]MDO6385321.1 nitrogen fixation protein NifZ [Uliginosibacterium sp. 31-12]NSL54857.1 nitrogen fixation protein NifZ [Uliginosibacterium aquaticum]PLK47795.1 nitrogen fixation protein NifZ [Uliginosibacterium sp. TH139]
MFELREAKFQWGQRVTAQVEIFNDGSYPEVEAEALLVGLGTEGEIVQIGHHEEANIPVYMVEFSGHTPGNRPCVIGVLEEEIAPL